MTQTYSIPGVAIFPLRLFLGITFVYAGLQKLTDPGFFTLGSRTYIGTQILQFSHQSPIHFLFSPFLEYAVPIGVLTILVELAIGAAVLLGAFTRLAALAGLILNLIFFLSASWNVYPYFLGADIVFVMAWVTLFIAGPGGYGLDPLVRSYLSRSISPWVSRLLLGPAPGQRTGLAVASTESTSEEDVGGTPRVTRAEALVGGVVALALVAMGLAPRVKLGAAAPSTSGGTTAPPGGAPSTLARPPSSGTKVGTIGQIPVNSGLAVTDPKTGDPAVIVHTSGSQFVAYDAICTHAGCTVQYDPQYRLLVCPCHGGAFDPAHGGQVVAGPPPAPLNELPIKIDASGNVYLT